MDALPLSFRLAAKPVLLVGAGHVAARKAGILLKAGAKLTVVAPDIIPELMQLLRAGNATYVPQHYHADLLAGKMLAVAATPNLAVNQAVAEDAGRLGIWVNVVDQPDLCTFTFPALVNRDPVVIGISSGGTAPMLARLLRSRLELMLPADYGRIAQLLGEFRRQIAERIADGARRLRFWEDVVDGPVAELVLAGRDEEARNYIRSMLDDAAGTGLRGEVWLVGAGPGDPDLLTIKAWRLMQKADVVLYDRLVAPAIVDLCRRDARRMYVGKRMADHSLPQQGINALLVSLAGEGRRVLRLKGGDPFIFGRGGEEIEALAAHHIPFQVVPGITAASGCASYAGIPLTHRDHARSVRFVTGHRKDGVVQFQGGEYLDEDETLVFYMGLVALPEICQGLIAAGRDPATPAALVQQGTTARQKVLVGTLSTLPDVVGRNAVKAPTLLIIGSVVTLHGKLRWYEGSAED